MSQITHGLRWYGGVQALRGPEDQVSLTVVEQPLLRGISKEWFLKAFWDEFFLDNYYQRVTTIVHTLTFSLNWVTFLQFNDATWWFLVLQFDSNQLWSQIFGRKWVWHQILVSNHFVLQKLRCLIYNFEWELKDRLHLLVKKVSMLNAARVKKGCKT